MRILGVDPGTLVVGFGCLELQGADCGLSAAAPGRGVAPDPQPIAHRVSNLARVQRGRLRVLDAGVLRLGRSKDPIAGRLQLLAEGIVGLIERFQPDELALEEAYFGKSVQSALRIGESRGVILAEASRAGLTIHQFPPARIKRVVAGTGAASKDQVAFMVTKVLRLAGIPETQDVTDALAVGLCCVEARRGFQAPPR